MQVTAYKSIDGTLFESEEEMNKHNESIKLENVLKSIDGWLESTYPSRECIVLDILVAIRKNYKSLSSKKLDELINEVDKLVDIY